MAVEYCQDLRCFNWLPCFSHAKDDETIVIQRAAISDLPAMKALQMLGNRSNIPAEEAVGEGFLTAVYSMELFTMMHEMAPAIVAKVKDQVVGFVLVCPPELRNHTEVLGTMFDAIDIHVGKGLNYIGVGQLCVGKGFRGKGISQRMYKFFQQEFCTQYEYLVCDVHRDNVPSLRAHAKLGFESIAEISYQSTPWILLLWRWREKSKA